MQRLSSPLTLGNVRLPNRIALTALPSGWVVPGGFVSDALTTYYLERARGGAGLLVIEPTCVLSPAEPALPHLGLYADTQVTDMYHCVEAVRREGAAVLVMLDQPLPLDGLRRAEVREIGEAFIGAAWRARAAGAAGVMLSTADGGPFEQLVSPLRNQRADHYGGSFHGRMRLLLDVVEGIQRWLGDRFIVGVRLNVEEFTPGGLTLQDARVIAKRLSSTGVILLEVGVVAGGDVRIAQFPGWRVPLAAALKAVIDIPVMVGGRLDDAELADSIVRDGSADLVAVGERLRVEPDWPRRALATLADRD